MWWQPSCARRLRTCRSRACSGAPCAWLHRAPWFLDLMFLFSGERWSGACAADACTSAGLLDLYRFICFFAFIVYFFRDFCSFLDFLRILWFSRILLCLGFLRFREFCDFAIFQSFAIFECFFHWYARTRVNAKVLRPYTRKREGFAIFEIFAFFVIFEIFEFFFDFCDFHDFCDFRKFV